MPESDPVTRLLLPYNDASLICIHSPVLEKEHLLTVAETRAISNAVEKRRREYATGRWLAHRALADLGVFAESIPTGSKREPVWPAPVVGSITHTDGLVAVAVTADPAVAGVGIDLERAGRVGQSILRRILTEGEQSRLGGLDPTLLFSAKEACYKVLFPIFREYVEFQAVEVTVDEGEDTFSLSYVGDRPDHALIELARGSYQLVEDCWLTCVVLPSGEWQ